MSPSKPTTLAAFNQTGANAALAAITHWCAAPNWAQTLCDLRPYLSVETLAQRAEEHWLAADEAECLSAFAAHPAIGDVKLLRSKYAKQANAEQGQVLDADDTVIEQLARQNIRYRERHGFTFIVFATGKSAAQMLQLLNERIDNSRAEEIKNAKQEQLKIMQLRLLQTFSPEPISKTAPNSASQDNH